MQIARGQRSDLVEDLGEDLSRPHNSLGVKNSIELTGIFGCMQFLLSVDGGNVQRRKSTKFLLLETIYLSLANAP